MIYRHKPSSIFKGYFMIITKLIGGLGNQMFQYAVGRRVADTNLTELKLDVTGYSDQVDITPRAYSLNIFNIEENFATRKEIHQLKKNIFLLRLFRKNTYHREKQFQFDSNILAVINNSYLEGYWVSEKYFMEIENTIRQEFSFKSKPNAINQSTLDQIESTNSISIHVRRGDYIEDAKTNQFHGVCRLDYYKTAISHIVRQVKNPHFFVFSDDPGWCKANLRLKYLTTYVTHNLGNNDHEDMRLMSTCKHNIIANSSFSWWGAWLNNNQDKIVVAPKQWFRDKSINTRDLIPESWIRI